MRNRVRLALLGIGGLLVVGRLLRDLLSGTKEMHEDMPGFVVDLLDRYQMICLMSSPVCFTLW